MPEHEITPGVTIECPRCHNLFTVTEAGLGVGVEHWPREVAKWHFPVGTPEYPPEWWYVATSHGPSSHPKHAGYHSGIDLNIEVGGRGDIDLDQPVWAVTDGTIHHTWYSESNLGAVVLRVRHDKRLLWVRYWHLAGEPRFRALQPGMLVRAGQPLGQLGDYGAANPGSPGAAAHLHLDMALEAIHAGVWWSNLGRGWPGPFVDPVPILKSHLDPVLVDMMIKEDA